MAEYVWIISNRDRRRPKYWSMREGWVEEGYDLFNKKVFSLNFPPGGVWQKYTRPLTAMERMFVVDVDAWKK